MNLISKITKYLLIFIAGIFFTYIFYQWTENKNQQEASTTIAYGIERLNKMVVAEQTYANFYSHKSSNSYLGNLVSFDKNLLLKVNIRTQASYDLSKIEIKVDSTNQTIFIKKIPELKIEKFPDVDFFEISQSKLNQFSKDDLNGIKKRAIQAIEKEIDYSNIKKQAEEQLIENLENIYILAKVYGWKVINETNNAKILEERIKA